MSSAAQAQEALLAEIAALRRGEPVAPSFVGARLIDVDLSGLSLMGTDLSGANLSGADLTGTNLLGARLRGTILFGATLTDVEMTGADLTEANLEGAKGERCGFGGADLTGAKMHGANLQYASFTDAILAGAVCSAANLSHSRFRGADLTSVDFTRATLTHCDLYGTDVAGARLLEADLRESTLAQMRGYEDADWLLSDMRDINFAGAYLLHRFAMDQNYLHEFRTKSRWTEAVYRLWWVTSDCGRSAARWGAVCLILVLAFAWAYTFVSIDYGSHETWLSPIYYSVVTITTLGYGDVLPASVAGQVVAMAQVVTGYLMLGGLLSIFSNKMARRAD